MYLGVDGGGTKTAFAIVNKDGDVVAEHETTGSYYLDIGLDGLRSLLELGVHETLSKAHLSVDDIRFAFFGLPAYGEDSTILEALDLVPSGLFDVKNYACDNDMVCAWAGSLACQDGINLIAGTGSIAFGRHNGRTARSGGWGEIFSDEGSAYWVARRGLQLFSKMSDGRLPRGPLYEIIRAKYQLAQDLDMSTLVLNTWNSDRAKIADLARLVFDAARAGDALAMDVIDVAATELADIVDATRRELGYRSDEPVPVSFSGGIFKSGQILLDPFERQLHARASGYLLVEPSFSPVVGAAYFAAVLDGSPVIAEELTRTSDQS